MSVTILIVDDHEVVREGVRTIINRARPQWEICGEAANGQEAIDTAMRLRPDIILLDITMPVLNGLDAATRISGLGLTSQILIFTMHESGELAHDARRVGARGYVTKSDAADISFAPSKRYSPAARSSVVPRDTSRVKKTPDRESCFDSPWASLEA